MSKVLTFSRTFPAYHPRKGEQTDFVEKILQWYWDSFDLPYYSLGEMLEEVNPGINIDNFLSTIDTENETTHKNHTIRAGNRWKVGDKFSPRVWSGKPYASKQIIIAPDIEIKYCPSFEIKDKEFFVDGKQLGSLQTVDCALNDGLHSRDFLAWFKYPKYFIGQIICWNENINY